MPPSKRPTILMNPLIVRCSINPGAGQGDPAASDISVSGGRSRSAANKRSQFPAESAVPLHSRTISPFQGELTGLHGSYASRMNSTFGILINDFAAEVGIENTMKISVKPWPSGKSNWPQSASAGPQLRATGVALLRDNADRSLHLVNAVFEYRRGQKFFSEPPSTSAPGILIKSTIWKRTRLLFGRPQPLSPETP